MDKFLNTILPKIVFWILVYWTIGFIVWIGFVFMGVFDLGIGSNWWTILWVPWIWPFFLFVMYRIVSGGL